VKPETRDLLKYLGGEEETYDKIVKRLAKFYCIQARIKEFRKIFETEEFREIDWDEYL
jgi:hypothetical protein